MIAQILANAWHILQHRNAEALQVGGWTDPRQHQELRGGDRPGTQNNLAPGNHESLATAVHFDARRFAPLKEDTPDLHIRPHRQVQPMPIGIEVGQRRIHPHPIGIIHGKRTNTFGVRVVVVVDLCMPGIDAGTVKGGL